MKKIILIVILLIGLNVFYSSHQRTNAAAPTCSSSHGGYCSYTGKVKIAYINSGNVVLIYFDTRFDPNEATKANLSISGGGLSAAAFPINDANKLFGQSLYATALAALNADKRIGIQMRGNYGGYLKVDRIWIHKD